MTSCTFDPIWEEKYRSGHIQRAPWDMVVSFIFRNAPKAVPFSDCHVLEVGCGTGGNLLFAAEQGFQVAGVDASPSAIETGKKRFTEKGLSGDLKVSDFVSLPFEDLAFDLVIDRGALTCTGTSSMQKALAEIHRVLRVGGRFLFNPYSDLNTSYSCGEEGEDGLTVNISGGPLVGVGQLRFYSRNEITRLLPAERWRLQRVTLRQETETLGVGQCYIYADWVVVAERK